ncbi:Aste57867_8557 [Aphanomyces stellatus]|uniref:Aste57867_3665 protein n=1 Tax=Aphanomyces stellatus TaxID=120398 RepID=A0A485KBT6_9STRA|nr:hypothetical protein As57867_008524 [Aphanomyces stellatus]KAF0700947.1 hypothetical protein As57867_008525 [Aphanomyces stellatus]KAF0714822.1 hypothetical protein As57867_003654 [Aphanomyces stellatus]VFT80820.1 Aste57867_3665 [Aphanomyces stellatus]VFT85442.1 Aste57867_8556 [Aphanomyces stellatus]
MKTGQELIQLRDHSHVLQRYSVEDKPIDPGQVEGVHYALETFGCCVLDWSFVWMARMATASAAAPSVANAVEKIALFPGTVSDTAVARVDLVGAVGHVAHSFAMVKAALGTARPGGAAAVVELARGSWSVHGGESKLKSELSKLSRVDDASATGGVTELNPALALHLELVFIRDDT